jgi:ABC-type glycerol-3-phosphate transport system substrate-binding protein
MQTEYRHSRAIFPHQSFRARLKLRTEWGILTTFICLLLISGCRQPPNLVDPEPAKPFKEAKLTLALGSGLSQPHLVRQFATEWSLKTGAKVEILPGTWDESTPVDLVLFTAPDLPRLVAGNKITPVPDLYRSARHSFQWNDLTVSITERLASWDARAYGLPVFNEGRVMLYRTDRWQEFASAKKLSNNFPETWEEFCEFAEFFNKPLQSSSLPPLAKNREELNELFHRIASCYDRVAVSETNLKTIPKTPEYRENFFSFDFNTETGEPRINSSAFVYAAELLQRTQACRPTEPSDHPLQSFREGKAVVAIAGLEILPELHDPKLPIAEKFRFAPLPGSRFVFEQGKRTPTEALNRVPYLGENVWFGSVTPNCKHSEAAWDFFTEFAHPNTSSLDFIAAGRWGASGFRGSHFDIRNRNHWFSYGFDGPQTEALIDLQRQNEAISMANPTLILRLPENRDYLNILRTELRAITTGKVTPKAGLDEVAKQWRSKPLDPVRYRIGLGL